MVAVQPHDDAAEALVSVARAAPFGLAVFRSGRCVTANPAFASLLGVATPELTGAGIDVFGTGGEALVRAAWDELERGRERVEVEFDLASAAGPRHVVVTLFTVGDAPHEAGGRPLVGIALADVSGRRESDRQRADLQALTAEFAAAATPEAVADVVIRAVLNSVGATGGALYLADHERSRLVAVQSRYHWHTGVPWLDVAIDDTIPVSEAVRTLSPVWIADLDEMRARFPSLAGQAVETWGAHAALPLYLGDEVLGAIVVSWQSSNALPDADRHFLEVVAAQCSQALARAAAFHRERSAREHTERVADHVLRLERITGTLGLASEPQQVVDRFLDECLTELGASGGAVLLADAEQRHLVPMGSRSDRWTPEAIPLDGDGPLSDAARTRQTVLLEDLAQIRDAVGARRAPDGPEQAWAMLPLVAYGELLGVAAVRYEGVRRFDADDRAFLDRVGRRLGEALDRSRLFARQREAREQAEAAARWLRSVQSLAAALARSATRRDVARALREHLHPATRADFSVVAIMSADRRSLDVLTGSSAFTVSVREMGASVDRGVRDSMLRGRSIELDDPARVEALFPTLAELGIAAFALVPVRAGHRLIGVIGMGWSSTGALSTDTRRLLTLAVSLGGAAFERATASDLDHQIAETLQRELLTPPVLDVPGLLWAARYSPGGAELTAGGDWYDVVPLTAERVALVVGDVVGHGVGAAAAMGQVRSATRALASREGAVGVLEALDAYVTATDQGNLSSMAIVVVDLAESTVEYAIAGHPPPLLRTPHGDVSLVDDARGPLLGIAPAGSRRSVRRHLEPGSTIVLYTDGLVERRGEPIDSGFARLAKVVRLAPMTSHPEGLCDRLLEQLNPGSSAPDDITLLVCTFQPVERRRVQSYPARPEMLRVIRSDLRTWLAANRVEPSVAHDVVLACDEVCADAFEHRTRAPALDAIELDLRAGDDAIELTIRGPGPWRPPADTEVLGDLIVRSLMQDVTESATPAGTSLTLRRRRTEST